MDGAGRRLVGGNWFVSVPGPGGFRHADVPDAEATPSPSTPTLSEVLDDADAMWKPGGGPTEGQHSDVRAAHGSDDSPVTEGAASPWSSASGASFIAPPGDGGSFEQRAESGSGPVLESPVRSPDRSTSASVVLPASGSASVHVGRGRQPGRSWRVLAVVAVLVLTAFTIDRVAGGDGAQGSVSEALLRRDVAVFESNAPAESPPLVVAPFAGADPRRLPEDAVERWEARLAGVAATSRTRLFVDGDRTVLGVFDAISSEPTNQPTAVIVALDATTGATRWTAPFESEARAFTALAVFDGVVMFERSDPANRSVLGLDVETGAVRWERTMFDSGRTVVFPGVEIVAQLSSSLGERLTFFDPASGDTLGQLEGRVVASDSLGRLYVRNGRQITELDLRDGWAPPVDIGRVVTGDGDPVTVVADEIVTVLDAIALLASPIQPVDAPVTSGAIVVEARRVPFGPTVDLQVPQDVQLMSPLGGSALLVSGGGEVFGAELGADEVDLRWRAGGVIVDSVSTDRGASLLLAADGGAVQRIVDASTGRTIVRVTLVPGATTTLEMVANGIVVKQPAAIGYERVALDLDGERMWSLIGEGPVAVGDGIAVVFAPDVDGVRVTAYGDAS